MTLAVSPHVDSFKGPTFESSPQLEHPQCRTLMAKQTQPAASQPSSTSSIKSSVSSLSRKAASLKHVAAEVHNTSRTASTEPEEVIELSDDDPDPEKDLGLSHLLHTF